MEYLGEERENKSKKILIILLIIAVILAIIIFITMMILKGTLPKDLRLNVDSKYVQIPSELFVFDNQTQEIYISLRDIASLIGYEYYNGEYNKYTEDTKKCYLQSEKQIVGFSLRIKQNI